jgi:hypothetical protein
VNDKFPGAGMVADVVVAVVVVVVVVVERTKGLTTTDELYRHTVDGM